MANCSFLFREFDNRIMLPEDKREALRVSRDSLRSIVRDHLSSKGFPVKFLIQGSFAMNTIIAPKDGDYDIDDGIYILSDSEPQVAPSTLHGWIVDAVESHTSLPPSDKNACVRVRFADGHHIDLVVYYYDSVNHPRLAHKEEGWIISDPKEFLEWFSSKCDEAGQLRRIVRYFKAWADELRGEMPSGLVMSILASNCISCNQRDDVSFLETLCNIQEVLQSSFSCLRPTTPVEDLLTDYSEARRTYFLERLESFANSGRQAMAEPNQKDACAKWKRHFGPRFPCEHAEDKLDGAKEFDTPAFIRTDARSA